MRPAGAVQIGRLRPISPVEGNLGNLSLSETLYGWLSRANRVMVRLDGRSFHVAVVCAETFALSSLAGFGPTADMARFLASIGHTDQQRLAQDAEYDP